VTTISIDLRRDPTTWKSHVAPVPPDGDGTDFRMRRLPR
jgi:hypothetical protein